MSRNRAGDAVVAFMKSDGCYSLCAMDGGMNDVWFDIEPPLKLWRCMNPHPLNRARVVASYLARDDRFNVGLMRGHDTADRQRRLRLFTLKPEFRQ